MSRFFFLSLLVVALFAIKPADRPADAFPRIRAMVDSNRFETNFTIASTHRDFYLQPTTPYLDQNIEISRDSAFVIVNDSIATGYLPYFGTGYSFPQTGSRGIIFHNRMINQTSRVKGKGRKQVITYSFEVVGNDYYKLNFDIQYDGTCYLYVNSTNRSPITYTGTISLPRQ